MNLTSYKDSIHYIIGYKIELLLKNKNHNNIIIYGHSDIGKTTLIRLLFKDIFNESYSKKHLSFNYEMNKYYYYFDLKKISLKNDIISYIKEIYQTFDYNYHKYIILDHFEELNQKYQNILKVIIEKGVINIKIFIITNKYQKVIHPILSRCISIRIKNMYLNDKLSYNILDDICDECCIIINQKITLKSIQKIRKISEKTKELNIPFNILFRKLLDKNKKHEIKMLKCITEYEYLHLKSYRPLIYIETLLLKLNEIIFFD